MQLLFIKKLQANIFYVYKFSATKNKYYKGFSFLNNEIQTFCAT